MIRRLVPFSLLPLALIACALASSPWQRAYPASVLAVPLFGAAVLSVLVPVIVIGIGVRRLWITALIDAIMYLFFTQLVALREIVGFHDLYTGIAHGPSQILTFALPLVSPRTLLVAPVTLCWISGAILGECVGRAWHSVVPYVTLLVTFGLAYGGTARAITSASDGRRYDTLLAGALLLTLLLMRAAQAWIEQDLDSESAQPDGVLPLRGLLIGVATSVVIALVAAFAVQAGAFSGPPTSPARVPPLDTAAPLSPVAFVAGLRPSDPRSAGTDLFHMSVGRPTSNYVGIADVDSYDGDGWSFDRTFRPSGGVVPAEADPELRAPGHPVTQQYTIDPGALTTAPWMPFLYRPQRITGLSVNTDTASGMVVPNHALQAGEQYSVASTATPTTFDALRPTALIATSTPTSYTFVPGEVGTALGSVVKSFENETGTSSTAPIAFLQALSHDLQKNYSLAGLPSTASSSTPATSPPSTPARKSTPARRSTPAPKSTPARHPVTRHSRSRTPRKHKGKSGNFVQAAPASPAVPSPTVPSPTVPSPTVPSPTVPLPTPTPTPAASPTPNASGTTANRAGGTSFANVLASILGASRSATPEQYATLVALVARQIGVPARLVAGFRVTVPGGGSVLPAGSYDVTTAEAWTWVEVPVQGKGWVVLDAAPGSYGVQKPQQSVGARPSPTPTPTVTPNGLVTQSNRNGHAVAPKSAVPGTHSSSKTSKVVLTVIIVVAAILVILLLMILRKRLRVRRRRRSGDPRRRLVGAWQESLDLLVEAGLPDLTNLTSAEVAATTDEHFGGEPAARARFIGDAANAAIFSPTSWVGPAEADEAWRAHVLLRKSVRRRLSLREKVGAGLRYHRTGRTRVLASPSSWASSARARSAAANSRGRHSTRRRRVR